MYIYISFFFSGYEIAILAIKTLYNEGKPNSNPLQLDYIIF